MVMESGTPDKRAWECALLLRLRDEIKSGNISVKHSKRFGRFDDFFIPSHWWESVQEEFSAGQVCRRTRKRLAVT